MTLTPPFKKLQDKSIQNFQICKLQNRMETAILEVNKYEDIEKSLWLIIFRSV